MTVTIAAMTADHTAAVAAIFTEGITTGNATFESEAPDWPAFDVAKLSEHRLVALDDTEVVGWAALSPTSSRHVYRGVCEVALYVTAGARGRGVGRSLLTVLIESSEAGGIWTLQAGIFPENSASLGLHESCGFRRLGVRDRIGLMPGGPYAGQWRDVVLLERRSPVVGVDGPA